MEALLALNSTTRQVGWAIFCRGGLPGDGPDPGLLSENHRLSDEDPAHPYPLWKLADTGLIVAQSRQRPAVVSERIRTIATEVDRMAHRWSPGEVVCGKPSLIQLPPQQMWMEMLIEALETWAQGRRLSLVCYTLREIRTAVTGRANVAKEELAYSMMTRWGLLGHGKTTHEWNAIAVGDYHLGRRLRAEQGVVRAPPAPS